MGGNLCSYFITNFNCDRKQYKVEAIHNGLNLEKLFEGDDDENDDEDSDNSSHDEDTTTTDGSPPDAAAKKNNEDNAADYDQQKSKEGADNGPTSGQQLVTMTRNAANSLEAIYSKYYRIYPLIKQLKKGYVELKKNKKRHRSKSSGRKLRHSTNTDDEDD